MQFMVTECQINGSTGLKMSPEGIVQSSLQITSSNESQMERVQLIKYQEVKTKECFNTFYENIRVREPKHDSLRYSESPEVHGFKKRNSNSIIENDRFGGYTPRWLLELLRERHVLTIELTDSAEPLKENNRSWTPRPQFTSLPLWNPFYRELELQTQQFTKNFIHSLSTFGKEKEEVQPFFMVPSDLQIVEDDPFMGQTQVQRQNQEYIDRKSNLQSLNPIIQLSEISSTLKMAQSKEKQNQNLYNKENGQSVKLPNRWENESSKASISFNLSDFFNDISFELIQIQNIKRIKDLKEDESYSGKENNSSEVEINLSQQENESSSLSNHFSKEEKQNSNRSDQNSKKSSEHEKSLINKLDDQIIEKSFNHISEKNEGLGFLQCAIPQLSEESNEGSQKRLNQSVKNEYCCKSLPLTFQKLSFEELNEELVEHIKSIDQMSKSCDNRGLEILKAEKSRSNLFGKIEQEIRGAFLKEQKKNNSEDKSSQIQVSDKEYSHIENFEKVQEKILSEKSSISYQKDEEKLRDFQRQSEKRNVQEEFEQENDCEKVEKEKSCEQVDTNNIKENLSELKHYELNLQEPSFPQEKCEEEQPFTEKLTTEEPIDQKQIYDEQNTITKRSQRKQENNLQCDFLTDSFNSYSVILPPTDFQNGKHENHLIELADESKYLKSSGNHLPLTQSEKGKILQLFNGQNSDIMREMAIQQNDELKNIDDIRQVQSEYSYSSQCDKNEKVQKQPKQVDVFAKSGFQRIKKALLESSEGSNSKTCPHPKMEEKSKNAQQFRKLGCYLGDKNMVNSINQSSDVAEDIIKAGCFPKQTDDLKNIKEWKKVKEI